MVMESCFVEDEFLFAELVKRFMGGICGYAFSIEGFLFNDLFHTLLEARVKIGTNNYQC